MVDNAFPSRPDDAFAGQSLGLPREGRGSLALWRARFTGLVLDWAGSMAIAVGIFGVEVLQGDDWRQFMILAVFFLETVVLTALTGSSFGQLICRIAVFRLDRQSLGFPRAIARALMVCLVIPALVIGPDRRGLHDLAIGGVVINRK